MCHMLLCSNSACLGIYRSYRQIHKTQETHLRHDQAKPPWGNFSALLIDDKAAIVLAAYAGLPSAPGEREPAVASHLALSHRPCSCPAVVQKDWRELCFTHSKFPLRNLLFQQNITVPPQLPQGLVLIESGSYINSSALSSTLNDNYVCCITFKSSSFPFCETVKKVHRMRLGKFKQTGHLVPN